MAIIYKIATVKIAETLATRGLPPPPLCYIVYSWYFPPFCFFFSVTYLKKICKGEERHYSIAKFCKRAEVLNFKIARAVEDEKF